MTVLAARTWRTNADLIADVAALWIRPTDVVIDVTYGRGGWWRTYRHPAGLFTAYSNLISIRRPAGIDVVPLADYKQLPLDDGTVDVAAFDPPYVAQGGRRTSTIGDFTDRYGLVDCPATPVALHADNMLGLTEIARVLRPGGLALVKSKDYISSGRYQPVCSIWLPNDADRIGLEIVDRFEHVGHLGAQPADMACRHCIAGRVSTWDHDTAVYVDGDCPRCHGTTRIARRQLHARRNLSTLFVLRKAGRP